MKTLLGGALALAGSLCLAAPSVAAVGWAGNVFPNHGATILPTGTQDVYAQVYKEGVTDQGGQGADISAVLEYTSDTHGSFSVPMSYLGDVGSNDEYMAVIPQNHIQGSTFIDVHVKFTDETDGSVWEDTNDQNGNPAPQRYDVVDVLPVDVDVTFTLCMSGTPTAGDPCVIGSAPEIGEWGTGVSMNQIDTELYEVTVTFAAGGNPSFEYKYRKDDCVDWEGSPNRLVTLPTDGTASVSLDVDSFNDLPLGCGLGDVLEEDKEICFEVCLGSTIDNTGSVCVIGSIDQLTNWTDGVTLTETDPGLWSGCIRIPAGTPIPINAEYKYKKDDCQTWESAPNRLFAIDNDSPSTQTLVNTWDDLDLDCTPVPMGACCFSDESCSVLTEDECDAAGGIYQGNDEPCDPNPCEIVPTIDSTWGQIKNTYRQ